LFFVKDQPFVMLNSMAFEDECYLCQSAEDKLQRIVQQLKTGEVDRLPRRPILLSHFPLFRRNQEFCSELDITHELVQSTHNPLLSVLPVFHTCRVVSCRVVSCRVVSCRVVSCRVVSCRVVSCRVVRVSCACRASRRMVRVVAVRAVGVVCRAVGI